MSRVALKGALAEAKNVVATTFNCMRGGGKPGLLRLLEFYAVSVTWR